MEHLLVLLLKAWCVEYLEDLLVHAPSFTDELHHLELVFAAIQATHLCLKLMTV